MKKKISWIDFRLNKPKQITFAVVSNEKGFMINGTIRAMYFPKYDVWNLYDPNYRESVTIEVTHYIPIPDAPLIKT